jgi:DivIVA domain-containing protein
MAVTREPEFGTVRMREGYDLDDVDDYVDLVIDALEGKGSKAVTPEQIERYEFRVVRMKLSYVMEDVDRWLDAASGELKAKQRAQRDAHREAPRPETVHTPAEPPPVPALPMPEAGAAAAYAGVDSQETAYWPAPTPTAAPVPTFEPPAPAYEPAVPAYEPPTYAQPTYGQSSVDQRAYDNPAYTQASYDQQTYAPSKPQGYGQPERQQGRAAALIHHVELWVRDFDSAVAGWGWLFQRLGWRIGRVWEHGCAWTSHGGPYIVIESGPDLRWMPHDRRSPGMNHLALEVADRATVDRIVTDGPAHGWQLMFPDRHPYAGGPDHYAAYMENAEGFEVEIVAAE